MHVPADPRRYLTGRWRIERELHHGDARGRFDGVAEFTPNATGLVWDETGELVFGGHSGTAWRRLRVIPGPVGWEVRFADGRLFHPIDLSRSAFQVRHDCSPDLYLGRVEILAADAFDVTWIVTGPAKNQRIFSRYSKFQARP
jgi:hypothetical protein